MKVAAHPLVVAVALGLVAPDALEAQEEAPVVTPCDDCPQPGTTSEWQPSDLPSADELHRVELEWLKATGRSA